jgi:transposase
MSARGESPERETVGFRRRREKRARAAAFLAGDPLIVGMDLAKRRHAIWFAKRDLTPIKRFMVEHSPAGLAKLVESMEQHRKAHGLDRSIVFMEATSYFWQNVANLLEAQAIAYRTVAPLAVDRQREIEHLTYAKGDYRDAELIARLGAGGQWLDRVLDREPIWIVLRALAYEHEDLIESEVAEQLRVRCLLGLAAPEFLEVFVDPLRNTARALLKRLTRPAPLPATFEALRERCSEVSGHRVRRGKIRAFVARLEAAPTFGVERMLAATLARVGLAVDRFELLAEQRRDLRAHVVALYEKTPYRRILDTIPGVVPENHGLLLGLIGDPTRYDRATCLAKLAGTEPRENHSGDGEGSHSISRRGRSPLRSVLFRIVLGFARGNPELAAYMARLQRRDKNPLAWHQAAVATGNKYLRLVHTLCTRGETYDPTKLGMRA